MRIGVALAMTSLMAFLAFAQTHTVQPLNAKTGLWQVSQTATYDQLPPQYAARMKNDRVTHYSRCVRAKDLSSNPWAEPEAKCAWTVLKSTSTDMEVRGTSCDFGNGMTGETHGTIHLSDAQDGTGSFEFTVSGNGLSMKGHASYSGKWSGSSCPQATE